MPTLTYATEDDLRAYLATDENNPGGSLRMQQCLLAAEDTVDAHARKLIPGTRAFAPTAAGVTRTFTDYTAFGPLPIDDVLTITAVTRGGDTLLSTQYQASPFAPGQGPSTQLEFNPSVGPWGPAYMYWGNQGHVVVGVTGTWGFCTDENRPAAIKEATLVIASLYYRKPTLPISEMLQAMRSPVNDDLALVRTLLDPFKEWGRERFVIG